MLVCAPSMDQALEQKESLQHHFPLALPVILWFLHKTALLTMMRSEHICCQDATRMSQTAVTVQNTDLALHSLSRLTFKVAIALRQFGLGLPFYFPF